MLKVLPQVTTSAVGGIIRTNPSGNALDFPDVSNAALLCDVL
jgi:hypothetical protein